MFNVMRPSVNKQILYNKMDHKKAIAVVNVTRKEDWKDSLFEKTSVSNEER